MHLQLFDYSLSKLCNRQRLPKSHSYCRCRAEGSSAESSSGHCVVVLQLFVDILVTLMSAAGFRCLRHLAGCQTMVKLEESPPSTLAVRESSSSPNLGRVSSTVRLNWLPQRHLALSDRSKWRFWASVTQTPPRMCCERAGVITSQRDAPPPNIWPPFNFLVK